MAIRDGYNGTGMNINGTPPGWMSFVYWSATPAPLPYGRLVVDLNNGGVFYNSDSSYGPVALQVLSATPAPVFF